MKQEFVTIDRLSSILQPADEHRPETAAQWYRPRLTLTRCLQAAQLPQQLPEAWRLQQQLPPGSGCASGMQWGWATSISEAE